MSKLGLWLRSLLTAMIFYGIGVLYIPLYRGVFDLHGMSEALAFAGGILLGSSFALSGMSYFFNFLDSKLKYRKSLGLLGYYLAFGYSLTLIFRFPDQYWRNLLTTIWEPQALLGLSAMAILSISAIASTNWATRKLGVYFRPVLRTGYIAYALLITRAILVEGDIWMSWIVKLDTLPPPRLLLSIFAFYVIVLRIFLEISIRLSKSSTAPTTPSTTPSAPSVTSTFTPPVSDISVGIPKHLVPQTSTGLDEVKIDIPTDQPIISPVILPEDTK